MHFHFIAEYYAGCSLYITSIEVTYVLGPFGNAKYVDPREGAGCDVDDPHRLWDQEEVDGLRWHPEHAAFLKGITGAILLEETSRNV